MTEASEELPGWMVHAFSLPRLAPYLRSAKGDTAEAVRRYWWNKQVSAAIYLPLGCLEVALRNSLHEQLTRAYALAAWWTAAPLNAGGRHLVEKAHRKCAERRQGPVTPDRVVAELTLGFWVSLVSNGGRRGGYDRALWVPTLHRAFPHYSGRRDALHTHLDSLLTLRNRIMHYEPIHERDLARDHETIYRVLGYLSPEAAREVRAVDPFPAVFGERQ